MAIEIKGAHVIFHRLLKASDCNSVQAILLCKRTQDAPTHPGHWGLIGGKVENGKTPEETARREVEEELKAIGINLRELVF
jgi:8-oxo-dGTP pyrophosphatase MutT (NUDIX family)